ncbi:MAG TPA: hypothetical protein VE999_07865 [Gemmataceae bacterium]|nr:hypothetical protein [Gemmataceae bacterium]
MLTVHLTCPRCAHNLRCRRLIAPGERLRCPHCGGQFKAGVDNAPKSAAAPRGRGILLAWLLFANLLLLLGGGITVAVALGNRAKSQDAEFVAWAESSKPTTPSLVGLEDSARPTAEPPTLAAPPSKPAPVPAPSVDPPDDPPKPPPLPEPPRRKAEPVKPTKEKQAEPEKLRDPPPKHQEALQAQWLPPRFQKQVDRSIDNGVEFLRRRQHPDGSWGHQTGAVGKHYTPGITALCALTLLECGVPAKDAHVRSAARYLRLRMPDLTSTYSISLAILFFDRLGEQSDAARIRTLALRLLAGQKPSGGWDYHCPILKEDEELGLLALLYKDRPTTPLDLFLTERNKNPALERETKPEEGKPDSDLYRPRPSQVPPLELFIGEDRSPHSAPRHPQTATNEERNEESDKRKAESGKPKAESGERLPGDRRRLSKRALEAAEKHAESLRQTPALRSAELLREPPDFSGPRTDNSNTQFAVLGLLTAENYDVPMERAMALLDWRFRNSMTLQDGWNYLPANPQMPCPTSPLSMTGAALMGLALKHGLLLPNRKGRGRDVVVHDDEIINRGFLTLTGMLSDYYASFAFNPAQLDQLDLYCLWTIERVAVLYNLRTLRDPEGNPAVEWYPAGVQLLLPLQRDDGSWNPKGRNCLQEPSVASSFALLFLKRSNLARGLTERLIATKEDK